MTYLATFYILTMNTLNSIAKSEKLVLYSSTLLMVLLFGGTYNCADDEMYKTIYYSIEQYGLDVIQIAEIGFSLIILLCTKIGLSFTIFKTLIALIGLFLVQKTTLEFSKKYSFVFVLYFIYTIMLDVIQIRNFLAASIVIYSIRFLIIDTKFSDIKYLLGTLIACSMHYMAVFYIPFFLINKLSLSKLLIITLIVTPVICVLTSTQLIPSIVSSIVSESFMNDIRGYFERANWGFLLLWSRQLAITFVAYMSYELIHRYNSEVSLKVFANVIMKLNLYLIIICLPMMMFNGNYFRLLRPMLILDYILIISTYYVHQVKGLILTSLTLFIVLSYWFMDVFMSNYFSVLLPFFKFNSYF